MKPTITSVFVALLLTSNASSAQDYMGMFNSSNMAGVNIAGTVAVNAAIERQARNAAGQTGERAAADRLAPLSAAQVRQRLTFDPDPSVSKRVKHEFKVAVQRADPAQANHIEQVLARQDVLADFDRDMAPYGLKSNNLADAMTAYWITMWMVANRAPVPGADEVSAAREQITRNMLQNDMAAQASVEQRQEITEGLVYEAMFALGQRANAERAKDRQRQRELADNAQRNLLKQGIDLQSMKLTRNGFVGG